ncbi:fasciclin domain-containing protein [Roseimarinus sediminis]|uniref:fasciclin domain-containing protein n=1 Tax=Roseimarinus sediminis TaxID=1610899 RepID=UPI003D1D0BE6
MTRFQYIGLRHFIAMAALFFFFSCNDNWEEHYNEDNFDLPEYSLAQYIAEQSELSVFNEMLKVTAYDSLIGSSQTFTVWAPNNEALSGIDLNDYNKVLQVVQTHIARNKYSTTNLSGKPVKMLSNKYLNITQGANGAEMGNVSIIQPNQPTKNGLVHVLNGYIPYQNNIWEHLQNAEGIDSLRNYLFGQTQKVFMPQLSLEIGVNDNGDPIYDSVFVSHNQVLGIIGELDIEDSIYTMLTLKNDAWSDATSRIGKYFNFPDEFGGVERKNELVPLYTVKDLVFRGKIESPASLDSITSTTNTTFHNPDEIFGNTQGTSLSNGIVFQSDVFPYADTVAWFNEIRIEAENSQGRENSNSNVYSRVYGGDEYDVSNNRYILVEPTTTSNLAVSSVEFSIPNILSASYNIYCVFVPNAIADPNNVKPMKAKFVLNYIRTTGGRTSRKTFNPEVTVSDPTKVTRLFVGQFDFEFANLVSRDYPDAPITFEVSNDVKMEEAEAFSRDMRIDCIILEPVMK